MTAILSSSQSADGIPADSTMPAPPCVSCKTAEQLPVVHQLTDSQREAAIHRAGDLFLHYMAKWDKTGDFQYRGDADRALRLQSILIQGRSAEQVAKLERERGLA